MSTASGRGPSVHAIGAAQLIAWGATFYAIPPLLPLISRGLDVALSTLALAMTVGLVLNAFAALAVARWIHHKGARVPMMVGSIVASLALVVLATSQTAAIALAAIAMLGAAQAALLYEPAFAAVSTQTSDATARTRAIQVITFWGGWAALWALPTASLLGTWLGWRWTLLALAALLATHTIRVHGALPPPLVARRHPRSTRPPPISIALAAAFALGAFATTAMVVNGLLLLAGRGLPVATASIVFASLAPFQVFGRLWFMRRGGQLGRHDGALPFVLVGAGVLALLAAPRLAALAIFVVLFGAGAGLLTTMRAAVVVARLAPEHAAMQLGTYSFVASIARALAPAASSWIYCRVGYEQALLTFAAMALVAGALVWRATACVITQREKLASSLVRMLRSNLPWLRPRQRLRFPPEEVQSVHAQVRVAQRMRQRRRRIGRSISASGDRLALSDTRCERGCCADRVPPERGHRDLSDHAGVRDG